MLRRHLVCFLTCCGLFILYCLRNNISIAVVAMTANQTIETKNGTIIQMPEFKWNSMEKGLILGSFFYGYTLAEIPCSWLADRYGGTTILGLEVLLTALFTFLIPLITDFGPYAVLVFRASTGIFESGSTSCVQAIWSRWGPENERASLISLSLCGISISYLVCYPVYGFLAANYGWRSLFYTPGMLALLWCIIWYINIVNDPSNDKRITEGELRYIQTMISEKNLFAGKLKYPWKKLMTSVPVWACIFTHFCQSWGYFLFSMELPSYLNDVWSMNTETLGFWLIVPHIPTIFITASIGPIDQFLRTVLKLNATWRRKIFQFASGFGCAVFTMLLAFSSSAAMSLVFTTMMYLFYAFYYGSVYTSPLDMAPRYASIIMGIINTAGCASAILSPLLTGHIVVHQNNSEWMVVFIICSVLYAVGTMVYLIFGTAELQSWASSSSCSIITTKCAANGNTRRSYSVTKSSV